MIWDLAADCYKSATIAHVVLLPKFYSGFPEMYAVPSPFCPVRFDPFGSLQSAVRAQAGASQVLDFSKRASQIIMEDLRKISSLSGASMVLAIFPKY